MVQAGYDYSRHWEPKTDLQPQVKMVKKTYKKVNSKRKMLIKFAGLAFVYALILVYLCIKGSTLGYQIVALEQELKEYEASNARLQYAIQESCSLDKVEQIATNQLGMYKPDKHISVAFSAPVVTVATNDTESSNNLVSDEDKPLYKLYANLLLLAEKN